MVRAAAAQAVIALAQELLETIALLKQPLLFPKQATQSQSVQAARVDSILMDKVCLEATLRFLERGLLQ
jgi:hypothetical protein